MSILGIVTTILNTDSGFAVTHKPSHYFALYKLSARFKIKDNNMRLYSVQTF